MNGRPSVIFAPVLRAEGWTSIDLQQENILSALRALDDPPEIMVLDPDRRPAGVLLPKQLIRDYCYPRLIRAAAMASPGCVLHVTDQSYGHLCAAARRSVVNCNDVQHFVLPELRGLRLARWKHRVNGMRQADRVLAISEHLAAELKEHLRLTEDRIVVLPGGVDTAVFHPLPREEACLRLPQVAALAGSHRLVLNIGTNLRRKNLPTLLRAVHQLAVVHRLPVKLVKIGPPLLESHHRGLIEELGLGAQVIDLGFLPPEQVAAACRLAHVLSFPSLYEGFGRPTLEAQACGLPCVLAEASCLREIGGSGALYHAPTDHEALAQALLQAMDDGPVRATLIAAGLRNAARFSWKAYASRLLKIYADVAR